MDHPAYQQRLALAGLASMNGARVSANSAQRSGRQRRRAFDKAQMKLIDAAWRRWGTVEAMPAEEQAKLRSKIARLQDAFGV